MDKDKLYKDNNAFLPVSKRDMESRGISRLDFVMVTGDAYVDHPSFAHAIVSRWLEAHGYSVGIIAQPDWQKTESFTALGKPRLGFLISAGNMDSMVNLYTVNKKRRARDMYSPGGRAGRRPARTTQVYAKKIREAYGDIPVIIGGIEASLRRFAHYDYWSGKVMPSILASSGADILIYGMGERALLEVADALAGGLPPEHITYVGGTVYKAEGLDRVYGYVEVPGENEVAGSKEKYNEAFVRQSSDRENILVQKHKSCYIIQNPPAAALSTAEMDEVYSLPYARMAHPMYAKPVPALEEVKFSITATRGCIGGCSFCALNYHQGKEVVWRSVESIVKEAEIMAADPGFKGYIHDVGGPTANLYGAYCGRKEGVCTKRRCLVPEPCPNLREGSAAYLELLGKLRRLEGIKKVFIRSGIRHDLALMDKSGRFIRELAKHHVSGQLKLAPEHVCPNVLDKMGKPDIKVYERFCDIFNRESKKAGRKQYVLPYFMSSHPGCTMKEAHVLAGYLHDSGFVPEQAQDFYPTPGTLATCMYYTGADPYTGRKVYVERDPVRKAAQRALIGQRGGGKKTPKKEIYGKTRKGAPGSAKGGKKGRGRRA